MEEYFFFWNKSPYTQWAKSDFVIDGIKYNTAEQWMMACKARHFKDMATLKEIMKATHPREQKELGRKVKNFIVSEWDKVARDYVYQGNMAKFQQNADMKKILLETKGTLVEASPMDCIWGIGLSVKNPDHKDKSKWRGKNWLGEVLTRVRDDLLAKQSKIT